MSHQGKLRNAIAFALLALACTWPYFETLRFWPMTGDPALWIGRGTSIASDWVRWVFLTDQFSWYRPLTALSFTIDHGIGGLNPLVYRLTDLALHVAAGYFVLSLGRVLAPRRAGWLPWAAATIFLMHPGCDEVVPYMARRSYSLATVFSLAGLCLLASNSTADAPTSPGRGRLLTCGGLLAAALLSNEAAAVTVLVALGLLWRDREHRSDRPGGVLLPAALIIIPVLGALCLRTAVLGGLGGYGDEALPSTGGVESLLSMWATLTGLEWLMALEGPAGFHLGRAIIGGTALVFLAAAALSSRDGNEGRLRWTPLLIALWLIGYAALIVASGLWVERQVYFLQVPFAWLATCIVARAFEGSGGGRALRILGLLPVIVVLGSLLFASPMIRGQRAVRLEGWRERQQLLAHIEGDLAELQAPACVHTALPNMRRRFRVQSRAGQDFVHQAIRHPFVWAQVLVSGRDIEMSDWVYFDRAHGNPTFEPKELANGSLQLPPGGEYLERTSPSTTDPLEWIVWAPGFALRSANSPRSLPYQDSHRAAGRDCYIYVASPSGGELLQIPD